MRVSTVLYRFGREAFEAGVRRLFFFVANVIHYNTAAGKSQPTILTDDVPVAHVWAERLWDDDRSVFLLVVFQNSGDRSADGQP